MRTQIMALVIALSFLTGIGFAQTRLRIPRLYSVIEASDLPVGAPTLSGCGVSPSISGTNSNGVITVGSGVSVLACTLTFSQTLVAAPICVVTPSLALGMGLTTNTTTLSMAMALTLGGGSIYYHCRAA